MRLDKNKKRKGAAQLLADRLPASAKRTLGVAACTGCAIAVGTCAGSAYSVWTTKADAETQLACAVIDKRASVLWDNPALVAQEVREDWSNGGWITFENDADEQGIRKAVVCYENRSPVDLTVGCVFHGGDYLLCEDTKKADGGLQIQTVPSGAVASFEYSFRATAIPDNGIATVTADLQAVAGHFDAGQSAQPDLKVWLKDNWSETAGKVYTGTITGTARIEAALKDSGAAVKKDLSELNKGGD